MGGKGEGEERIHTDHTNTHRHSTINTPSVCVFICVLMCVYKCVCTSVYACMCVCMCFWGGRGGQGVTNEDGGMHDTGK